MEDAKRATYSQAVWGLPAGASTPSDSNGHTTSMPILLQSSPLRSTPASDSDKPPYEGNTANSNSSSPAFGSSSNQPDTQGYGNLHTSVAGSANIDANASTGTFPVYEYPHHFRFPTDTVPSFAPITVTSYVKDPSQSLLREIEFGGRTITATAVELSPVMNSGLNIEPEAVFSTSDVDDQGSQQNAFDVSQDDAPREYQVNFSDYLDLLRQQYARLSYHQPQLRPFLEAQIRLQAHMYNTTMNNNNMAAAQNQVPVPVPSENGDEDEALYNNEPEYELDGEIYGEQVEAADTSLDEDTILHFMRTEKYRTPGCSICWEEYKDGDELGLLDCDHKHRFHIKCIKNWLMRQNTCPLCRMTGLHV